MRGVFFFSLSALGRRSEEGESGEWAERHKKEGREIMEMWGEEEEEKIKGLSCWRERERRGQLSARPRLTRIDSALVGSAYFRRVWVYADSQKEQIGF